MTYLVLVDSLARAKERAGTSSGDEYLTELLTLSAGTDGDGITHYRPFYCAAKYLEQSRADQSLESADGATFTGQKVPIASLLNLQLAYDKANGLTIPEGFEAIPINQPATAYAALGTRSFRPTIKP